MLPFSPHEPLILTRTLDRTLTSTLTRILALALVLSGVLGFDAARAQPAAQPAAQPPAAMAPLASARARSPQRLLLAIGVSSYQDTRWKSLEFADKDATDIHARLGGSGGGGGAGYDALPPVTSERFGPEGVTLATLRQHLRLLKEQNAREDDVVIVYFSGHGTLARSLSPLDPLGLAQYLVTSDTQYDRVRETALPRAELLAWFNGLKSKRKALILDACFSGEGKGQWTTYVQQIVGRNKGNVGSEPPDTLAEGSAVYSASSWGLPAEESKGLRNGVYTHFLLKGFEEDFDGDGAVRLSEAHLHALDAVETFTEKRQRPTVIMELTGKDPVIVKGREARAGKPLLFAWNAAERNLRVLIDNVKKTTLAKGSLDLEPGRRRLTLVDPVSSKPVFDGIVHFREDVSYNVGAFLYPSQPHNVVVGGDAFFVPERALRTQALPSVMFGAKVSYFTESLVDFADVGVSYAAYLPTEHDVRRDVRLRSVEVGGVQTTTESQTTSQHAITAGLLRRSPLAALSNRTRTLVTEGFVRGAVGTLYVVRESDLFASSRATNWLPGGDAGVGLTSAFPDARFRLLAEGGIGLWANTFDVGSAVLLSTHVTVGIGGFW